MKRKILYVITKSNWGGAQRYVFDLATHLPREQFEPVVAFGPAQDSDTPGLLAEKFKDAGVRTIFLPSLRRDVGFFDLGAYRALSRLFAQEQPDIVHLNSSKAGGIGALAARFVGVPRIIFTAHGWAFREARNPLSQLLIWLASCATIILSHATLCVSESDRLALTWIPYVGRKLTRIYNGIELTMTFGSGAHIRAAFPSGVRITGTIGELTANKNHMTLLEEARHDPNLYVAIVGEGEDRDMLKRTIAAYGLANRVKLFGFIPSAEVLKGFDCFVLPSLKEGLPYVLIEAKLANLPITANRVGGVGEILDAPLELFSVERMVRETISLYVL